MDRIVFSFFGINIYWYGITYLIGFLFSYFFILEFSKNFNFKKEIIEDILFYVIIFSIIFGRIFHILFYDPIYYFNNLSEIIRFDHGGMSIHGGIFGSFIVLLYYSKKYKLNLLKLLDLFVLPASFGLAIGRLANFINQELVGKITSNNIGVIFPNYDKNLRWPTTIFESIKNMFVFQFLLYKFMIEKINKTPGLITGYFLFLFNFLRFLIDFLRIPDVIIGPISMGQLLSLLYSIIGLYLILIVKKHNK